jgi:hypothetical protein
LYLAGKFWQYMSGIIVNCVARWDRRHWARVGAGIGEQTVYVYALLAIDDPNTLEGETLYAGAVNGVYKHPNDPNDANEWWPPGAMTNAPVRALALYEGALYAGGAFTCIRTPDPNYPWAPCDPNDPNQVGYRIARWHGPGTGWEVVGVGAPNDPNTFGMDGPVLTLTVLDVGDHVMRSRTA